jgi:hypothetical protein
MNLNILICTRRHVTKWFSILVAEDMTKLLIVLNFIKHKFYKDRELSQHSKIELQKGIWMNNKWEVRTFGKPSLYIEHSFPFSLTCWPTLSASQFIN